ncbi:hypothetical protein SAMN02910409_0210 [Prevotellaceae bacterium HUN156]|jgi:hypothetical protein|nr:hypothetical protein SAMN02910409_0210 [Prevotellaceae bacterium HUN156]
MKKEYMEPLMEAVEIATMGMLCVSGGIDDDPATDPAKSRLFDDDTVTDFFNDDVITNEDNL